MSKENISEENMYVIDKKNLVYEQSFLPWALRHQGKLSKKLTKILCVARRTNIASKEMISRTEVKHEEFIRNFFHTAKDKESIIIGLNDDNKNTLRVHLMRITRKNDKFYISFYIEHKNDGQEFSVTGGIVANGYLFFTIPPDDRYPDLIQFVPRTNVFEYPDDEHPLPLTSNIPSNAKWIVSESASVDIPMIPEGSFIQENNSGFYLGKIIDKSEVTRNKIVLDIHDLLPNYSIHQPFEGEFDPEANLKNITLKSCFKVLMRKGNMIWHKKENFNFYNLIKNTRVDRKNIYHLPSIDEFYDPTGDES